MASPYYSPLRIAAGTGGYTAGSVVYISSSTLLPCDADSSQAATAALLPVGVASETCAVGEFGTLYGESPQGIPYRAAGAIPAGSMLVCADGEAGAVIAYDVGDYSDGDEIYIVGTAHETAAAGNTFRGSFAPRLLSLSIPA